MKDKINPKIGDAAVNPIQWEGLTTPDVQGQGGAPLQIRRYIADDGQIIYLDTPGAAEILTSGEIGDLGTMRTENGKPVVIKKGFLDYDPVRDVQPSSQSAPAPAASGIDRRKLEKAEESEQQKEIDEWAFSPKLLFDLMKMRSRKPAYPHGGDNGIETDTGLPIDAPAVAADAIRGTQSVDSILNHSVDINRIGAKEDKDQPLRKPTDLDIHMVESHRITENPTLFPLPEVKQLHLEMHAQGMAPDHNPEVLKVASLNHILGDKETQLNFLPKIGELIPFPPEPGDDSWMFPYSIQERFVESPKEKR